MPNSHIYSKYFLDTGNQYSTGTSENSEDQMEGEISSGSV